MDWCHNTGIRSEYILLLKAVAGVGWLSIVQLQRQSSSREGCVLQSVIYEHDASETRLGRLAPERP